jgi:hypothetical protein
MESIGKMIQDLFHSDNVKANAAIVALDANLEEDEKKKADLMQAGGCFALVQLMQNCLDKAIDSIPACDQVTELNESAELTTLHMTLSVIISLTFRHKESKVGISAIGGGEAVAKGMKTFPKCQAFHEGACGALDNLTCSSIGKKKAIESGGLQLIIAAVNNHLGSAYMCQTGCWALHNIVNGSKENTELLISLGGGAAVAKVRRKWPNNDLIQTLVRKLARLFALEWKACANEGEDEA